MIESLNQTPNMRERMRTLEESPLDPADKLTLAYLLLIPQKTGALLARAEGIRDEPPSEKQQKDFEKEWGTLRTTLNAMHVPYLIDRPLGVQEGVYRYRIVAAKKERDLQAIRKLINAEETEQIATEQGRLMGYPATAVAAYRTSDAMGTKSDIPKEEMARLHAEHLLPFLPFKLSRTHYREELNRVRLWQRLIRVHCPQLYTEIIERDKREQSIQSIRDAMRNWFDAAGYGIESGIAETVAVLNVAGLLTRASCEGHVNKGIPSPWIDLGSIDAPEWQFIGEKEIYEDVALEFGIPLEDVTHSENDEAYNRAIKLVNEADLSETPEYQAWDLQRTKICEHMAELIEEYRAEAKPTSGFNPALHHDRFTIGVDIDPFNTPRWDTMTEQGVENQKNLLVKRQDAMHAFTEWLREQYLRHGKLLT